jgi:hypothetical protein
MLNKYGFAAIFSIEVAATTTARFILSFVITRWP